MFLPHSGDGSQGKHQGFFVSTCFCATSPKHHPRIASVTCFEVCCAVFCGSLRVDRAEIHPVHSLCLVKGIQCRDLSCTLVMVSMTAMDLSVGGHQNQEADTAQRVECAISSVLFYEV